MAEAQRAPPPSPVPLLSYGKPFGATARQGWTRYAVQRAPAERGARGEGGGERERAGSEDDEDDEDDADEDFETGGADFELAGSMMMAQSGHVAELKTSEFITQRVSELDRSLKDLIVDGDGEA